MKSNKGITLISLVITIILLIILTFTVTINVGQYSEVKVKTNVEKDLVALKEEINQYYAREKELPIINRYINTNMFKDTKNINDSDEYYVINIELLDVDLNYGKDFEEVRKEDINYQISDLLDVYIINKQSHTIYYPKGFGYNGEVYYRERTEYTEINNVIFNK